jgi:NADPH:quinone reductase-like Zn-dependent oxidoreductase
MGWTVTGAYAEYAVASNLAHKPGELDWDAAAALPVATETSDRVLDLLEVGAGETLLIHGAAGVTGSVGVQLARARGASVIGTASEANHDYLRSLGAIPVAYGSGLGDAVRAAAPQGVDAVYDAAGVDALDISIQLRGGITDRIVTIADLSAMDMGIIFSFGEERPFGPKLAEYARLAADDQLAVRIARSFPLAEARTAHNLSEGGHPGGKLVLRP